jgi:hypothetical protein
MDSQDLPRLEFGGIHHLPPYSILYAWPHGQHPNDILFEHSQVESLEIPYKGYNFALNLVSIGGLQKKLWASKVARVPISGILGLPSWES